VGVYLAIERKLCGLLCLKMVGDPQAVLMVPEILKLDLNQPARIHTRPERKAA
jgi:hypothetical protein